MKSMPDFTGSGFSTAQVAALNQAFADNASALDSYTKTDDSDKFWVLYAGSLVFLMQLGFGMLEAGSVRSSNASNIMFKNLMDACLGALVWFLVGFGFSGGGSNTFIGEGPFALASGDKATNTDFVNFFFSWTFAATAATIVSGSVAERVKLHGYFIYTVIITAWVYPVVVHWGWSSGGFMSGWTGECEDEAGVKTVCAAAGQLTVGKGRIIDFAGSGIVHMVGGFSGLIGSIAVGKRIYRFTEQETSGKYKYRGHSMPLVVLGTFLLWFGWYGFNPGSTLALNGQMANAARVQVTTTMAASAGGITVGIIQHIRTKSWQLGPLCNGILAGLVAITAGCPVVGPGYAWLIGFIAGLVYIGASELLIKLKVDDPLDAFPVHGCCGFWGVMAAGIFMSYEEAVAAGYYATVEEAAEFHAAQVLVQFIGALVIACWTLVNAAGIFFTLKWAGMLRVSEEDEIAGLDRKEHGSSSYGMTMRSLSGFGSGLGKNRPPSDADQTPRSGFGQSPTSEDSDEPADKGASKV